MTATSDLMGIPPAEATRALRILESMPGFAWSADVAGRVTYVGPNSVPDGEDESCRDRVVHPNDLGRVFAEWRHGPQAGDRLDDEHRLRCADGVDRWFRISGRASRDGQGRITHWYGTAVDIEDQKRAETGLRDRERELSQLVDMVPSHLWRLAPNGEPIFFNKRMVDFLGVDISDLKHPGTSRLDAVIEAVHPDDAAKFRTTLGRCLVTGDAFALRYRLRRADGVYRWMSSRAEPLRDEDGRIVRWYGLCHDIDDQMRADEALRHSEHRLQQLIDTVPALIWCTTPQGIPCYLNKRVTDVTGVALEDLIAPDGSRSLTVVHPDDQEAVDRALARSIATGEPFLRRYRQRRSNGPHRWVESRAEPLRDGSGSIVQWYGVSVDVHDLVTAQEALRDRERELSQLVDMVPSYLWRLAPDGAPTFFNKRLADFLGLGVPEAGEPGMSRLAAFILAAVHPDDAPGLAQALEWSVATGERFSMRYRLRRADGVYRWVEGSAEPLRDEGGSIVQWYGLSHDIDDQLRVEEALRERERSLRRLVETLPAMIDCVAPDGEPIYRSQQLRAFLGCGPGDRDEVGRPRLAGTLEASVHPDELAGIRDTYARSLSTGEPYARRHRLRRFDGEYRWVEVRAAPMRNAGGAIAQWSVVCLDVDGEVRAQEDLRLAREGLARATQAASLSELSASIAHEVNQPLAAVVANSHACQRWLAADPPNIERAQKTVERIVRDANAAAEVVSRVRALFRQSAGARSLTALDGVIAEARDLMAEEARRRRVRIEVAYAATIPPLPIDRVQIQQVVINLMRNGMEAMDSAVGERVLRICVRRLGDVMQTRITDCGAGIESTEKVFEPFYTTKANGMGMGLAICRSIVESHGGRLWAESNEPHGATFAFTLPLEAKGAS